jgi:predicted nucleic acid-binding protein
LLDDAAWRIFEQFDDQAFSFTDCSSIAICRALHIDTVFGFDRRFTITGLTLEPSV